MYKSQEIDKFLEYVKTADADLYDVVFLLYCSYNPTKAPQRRCEHVFQKGNRTGQTCNVLIDAQQTSFCKQHRKIKTNVTGTLHIDINSVQSEEDDVDDHVSELNSESDHVEPEQYDEANVSDISTEYNDDESEQWSAEDDDPVDED